MSDLRIQLREYGHQLDLEATPLENLTPQRRSVADVGVGWRGPLVALGTATVIIVIAVAVAFMLRGTELADPARRPAQPPVTTVAPTSTLLEATGPEIAFSWDGDDLGDWVTDAEMSALVTEIMDREGQAVLRDEVLLANSGGDTEWTWTFQTADAADGWRIIVHNGDHSPEGGRVDPMATDPRLPSGVKYEKLSGFAHGFYGLSGPNSDETICLTVFPPNAGFGYPEGSEVGVHEDRVFAVASMVLREMGWTGSTESG